MIGIAGLWRQIRELSGRVKPAQLRIRLNPDPTWLGSKREEEQGIKAWAVVKFGSGKFNLTVNKWDNFR